jgi:hypothetical protein
MVTIVRLGDTVGSPFRNVTVSNKTQTLIWKRSIKRVLCKIYGLHSYKARILKVLFKQMFKVVVGLPSSYTVHTL